MENTHRAGFVSIIGKPNAGKSTLMNKLVGEQLSITTPKAQTTRHRIMGMLNGDDFQIVYSDTPGLLHPKYELHQAMMNYVKVSLEDADIVLLVVDVFEMCDDLLKEAVKTVKAPLIILLNKIDLSNQEKEKTDYWRTEFPQAKEVMAISAKTGNHLEELLSLVKSMLPIHAEYFPKDEYTDRAERFFAAEIIREKIFLNYEQEIPYSCEVVMDTFKEEETLIRLRAIIFVERQSQKGILIGKGGKALKKTGTEARKSLEEFFNKKVFLETFVKVVENWRKESTWMKKFGYHS